ncbi:putative pentatricopeptide repeat-containing protein At2g01510 [Papaver somniferum]|uniref:putative pentatricopeptide repeat-containing protein At2g01510 n=1 Tax=Papaver somniferum TaxID=3469 RepID=UPI000E6F4821|nr:putative pentatricopeptide repeat-containing protein At2g01510 [Papaver somniferum]
MKSLIRIFRTNFLLLSCGFERSLCLSSKSYVTSSKQNVVDSRMIKTGFSPNLCKSNSILEDYVKTGNLYQARQLFDEMPERNVFSTNLLISGYVKAGDIFSARDLFDRTVNQNAVTWTILIGGYARRNETSEVFKLFSEMRKSGIDPDHVTIVTVLSACNDPTIMNQETRIHGLVVKMGHKWSVVVCNALVDSYCKSHCLDSASRIFEDMEKRDCVTYNAMITGYGKEGYNAKSVEIFVEMQHHGFKPSDFTFAAVLGSCVGLNDLSLGQQVHCFIVKTNFVRDVFVSNALLDFYSKLDKVICWKKLFDEMPYLDGVSYNIMITGYAWYGQYKECLEVFRKLQLTGFDRKQFPFATLLSTATALHDLQMGRQIHAQVVVTIPESEAEVINSLIGMYVKCGTLDEAKMVFRNHSNRNAISWTSMISSYVQKELNEEALNLFIDMCKVGVNADQSTLASVLKAAANLGSLGLGKQLHSYIIRSGFMSNVFAGSALLDAYANCGSTEDATQTFDEMPEQNIITWNAMIAAYARNGDGEATFKSFKELEKSGLQPDQVTFLSILSACSHCGLVTEGLQYFDCMSRIYKLDPLRKHYACMVDILARNGLFEEVERMMSEMPYEPDEIMLTSILSSCKVHKNKELGIKIANQLFKMDLKDGGAYVILSNFYAEAGNWDEVAKVKKAMKDRGVKKVPAMSWVDIKQTTHSFSSNDKTHPQFSEISQKLDYLSKEMEKHGYRADTSCYHHNVEEGTKAESLMYHSERLAIAYALISTRPGSTIHVKKNLRACVDCHAAIKLISKIERREIVVRDASRYHHFRNGFCSCGDYW